MHAGQLHLSVAEAAGVIARQFPRVGGPARAAGQQPRHGEPPLPGRRRPGGAVPARAGGRRREARLARARAGGGAAAVRAGCRCRHPRWSRSASPTTSSRCRGRCTAGCRGLLCTTPTWPPARRSPATSERWCWRSARIDTGGRTFTGDGRGGRLADHDQSVAAYLADAEGMIDTVALRTLWARLRGTPRDQPDVTTHGDLMPGNLLVTDGRLAAVIDVGMAGPADPALDLQPAWNLLDVTARGRRSAPPSAAATTSGTAARAGRSRRRSAASRTTARPTR